MSSRKKKGKKKKNQRTPALQSNGSYSTPHIDQWTTLPRQKNHSRQDLPRKKAIDTLTAKFVAFDVDDQGAPVRHLESRASVHHQPPLDPMFAIEFPGETFLGPNLSFMAYGGFHGANMLDSFSPPNNNVTLDDASIAARAEMIQHSDRFISALSSQHMHSIDCDKVGWKEIGWNNNNSVRIMGGCSKTTYESEFTALGPQGQKGKCAVKSYRPTLVYGRLCNNEVQCTYWGTSGQACDICFNNDHEPIANQRRSKQSGGRVQSLSTTYLDIFHAMVECGDTEGAIFMFDFCKSIAYNCGRLVEFGDLADRFVQTVVFRKGPRMQGECPGFEKDHRHCYDDIVEYCNNIGEVHEAAANLLSRAGDNQKDLMLMEMKRAVCSYKFGAYQGSRKGVLENNLIDQDSVAGSWSHAGVAIRRYIGLAYDESENTALYEAAERCYRWAICLSVETLILDSAKDNFMNCLRFKTAGKEHNEKKAKKDMKFQRKDVTKRTQNELRWNGKKCAVPKVVCGLCGASSRCVSEGVLATDGGNKKLLKCSRCKCVSYCCKEHQRAAWPKHKQYCAAPSISISK